jgi:hypothetical protein
LRPRQDSLQRTAIYILSFYIFHSNHHRRSLYFLYRDKTLSSHNADSHTCLRIRALYPAQNCTLNTEWSHTGMCPTMKCWKSLDARKRSTIRCLSYSLNCEIIPSHEYCDVFRIWKVVVVSLTNIDLSCARLHVVRPSNRPCT